jgi:hypothetical protein
MEMDNQYRIKVTQPGKPDAATMPTEDPKVAGEAYRYARKQLEPGQEVTLQRRPLGKWEDIEKGE